MNSTPNLKEAEANDVLIARADARLAHAYEQIAHADEQLARVTEQLSRMEKAAARDPSAVPGRQASRGNSALRGIVGLLLAACIGVGAFVFWRYGQTDYFPVGAVSHVNSAGKFEASGAAEALYSSAGRGGGSTCASDTFSIGRRARRRASGWLDAFRVGAVVQGDDACSHECGARG